MLVDWHYRVALLAVAAVQLMISRSYLKSARAGSTLFQPRAEGTVRSVLLGASYTAYSLSVLLFLINPMWMAWSTVALPATLRSAGIVIMALGAALHVWGMHHLGKNLTLSIRTRKGHTLTTTGPFAWVRHPLYIGGMVESIGVCMLLANAMVALCVLAFWTLVVWRTPLEEKALRDAFGLPYNSYCQQVGRFLPRFRRGQNEQQEESAE